MKNKDQNANPSSPIADDMTPNPTEPAQPTQPADPDKLSVKVQGFEFTAGGKFLRILAVVLLVLAGASVAVKVYLVI